MEKEIEVLLHYLAHARSGDKGNRLNIGLFAYKQKAYPLLVKKVTTERVGEIFRHRQPSRIKRYELPKISAMNFVIDDVLEGGVNFSLNLDGHGKTLSYLLLSMMIRIPEDARDLIHDSVCLHR